MPRTTHFISIAKYIKDMAQGDFAMRMDTASFGVFGNLGKIYQDGLKFDALAEINASSGIYACSVLDTSNANRNGQSV